MIASTKTQSVKAPLVTALTALVMLLATGPVGALYPPDGTKPDPAGGYMIPADGMCVVGVKLDGTMLVDFSITNQRDCVAWTKAADGSVDLVSMNTQASCVNATDPVVPPNDGYRHAWSTSLCYDVANSQGISRVDLDNTAAMCTSKGGTVVTTGKCVAYGWVYRNRIESDNSLPVSAAVNSTPVPSSILYTTDGVRDTDQLGFCATSMRMTSATYTSAGTCPSFHNSPGLCTGGTAVGASCTPANASSTCTGGGTCTLSNAAEWPACASSTAGCQTQTSYNDGLGWSWDRTNSRCLYAYGITGIINAAATKADGTTNAAGSTQDLTQYASQGDCLANGFSWDNWLPVTGTTSLSGGDLPPGATIRKLDALSSVEDGGGEFYSGTGAICEKCHSDMSRSYMERYKPGFPKTRHKLAGDAIGKPFQPFFTDAASSWGLQGVQCAMCHSTAKPAQNDLIQIIPAGVAGPPAEGNPKSAAGHNNTEYGTHLLDICYTCHGTPVQPPLAITENPAAHIPVFNGDFKLTANLPGPQTSLLPVAQQPLVGGLAPIVNQFLNSPHAKYTGTSLKVDIGNKDNYGSTFEGYVCRSSNGIGSGSILTTVYRNGVAEKIPNLDSTTNPACTNPGDGTATSGAGGFWVRDGETSPGGSPADTAQGNCMTCHDVHWTIESTDPESPVYDPRGEPFRRECPTCHTNGASAVGAPQVDLTVINHLKTPGTPLENWQTDPEEACETCHMPESSAAGSRMHLWRINTDPLYNTMGALGATEASLVPADGYPNAAWVDIPHACGQCHGTNGINGNVPGAPALTTAALATVAKGMHSAGAINYFVNFNIGPVNGLEVPVTASVDCGGATCPTADFRYDWDWGEFPSVANGTGNPATHTYPSGGSKSITLTVRLFPSNKILGSATRSVTLFNPDLPPTVVGHCRYRADRRQMKLVDRSTDDGPDADTLTGDGEATLQIVVDWGDGSTKTITKQGTAVKHTYLTPGTYTVTHTAIDAKLQKDVRHCKQQTIVTGP